jgi:putative ABC transport system permease protein
MLRATLKSLLARKLRLVLSGLAVVLGVMFVSGAFVLTDTLGRSFDSLFGGIYGNTDVQVVGKSKVEVSETEGEQVPGQVPAALVDQVRSVPGVADATGLVGVDGARVIGSNGKVVGSFGPPRMGVNWTGESGELELRQGRGPTAPDEVAINAGLAEAGKLAVGDRVGVLTLEPKRTFTLVGVFGYSGGRDSLGGLQQVAFTTPVAQQLMLGAPDTFTAIDVKAARGVSDEDLRDRLAGRLGADVEVKTGEQLAEETSADLKQGLSFFNRILLGFAGVALFVGIFLILNTFSIIIAQRTRELALMRAVGASRGQVIRSVLLEAVAIGLVASVLGLALGVGVGAGLAALFASLADGLPAAGLAVPMSAVISAFAVGLTVTVLASLLPAVRASRIPPVAAMQDAATPDKPLTRITFAGGVTLAAGLGLMVLGLTDNAGDATVWAILGGVLVSFIGVALLTPLVSRPVVALIGRLFSWSVPGKLGRLNSGRNPRRTAITAAALMVGIALITGVSVILGSATRSVDHLIADQVHAELFVAGEQSGPRPPTFDRAVLGKTAALPGVAKVAGIYSDRARIGDKLEYVGATDNMAALRDIFGLRAVQGSVDALSPDQVVVDENTAKDYRLSAGSTVTVQLSRGAAHTFTVAGVYADTDLFGGFVLPPQAAADFANPQPEQALVQLTPGTPVGQVQSQVDALLADSPEVTVNDRKAFIDQQTSDVDTVLTMIQVLLALAILIAVLGIVNTLALSVLERTRELGLLRAIGLRRAQTMRMITVEAVVISVFGALLGVAVGGGLGAAVVESLRDEGFSALVFPWGQMGLYVALAVPVGVIAAVLPAIRGARVNVLDAIAYE